MTDLLLRLAIVAPVIVALILALGACVLVLARDR